MLCRLASRRAVSSERLEVLEVVEAVETVETSAAEHIETSASTAIESSATVEATGRGGGLSTRRACWSVGAD